MDDAKRKRLEAKGWQVGTVTDFLQLTPEEEAIVEFKLALSHRFKEMRKNRKITQQSLANRMNSVFDIYKNFLERCFTCFYYFLQVHCGVFYSSHARICS